MKTLASLLLSLLCFSAFAQKSDSTTTYYRIVRGIVEHNTELKSKKGIRNGYSETKNGRVIVAAGYYKDGERFGRWRFFNRKDTLEQVYNYTTKKLEYNLENERISVSFDSLEIGDKVVKPAKIGGVAYPMNFLFGMFNRPYEFRNATGKAKIDYIFSLDENGTLLKYEIKVESAMYNNAETIKLSRLRPEDFLFTPAKRNGKYVKSKLIYSCEVNFDNRQIIF